MKGSTNNVFSHGEIEYRKEWVEGTIYRHCKSWKEACVIIHQFTFYTSHLLSAEKMLQKKGVGTFITSSNTCI